VRLDERVGKQALLRLSESCLEHWQKGSRNTYGFITNILVIKTQIEISVRLTKIKTHLVSIFKAHYAKLRYHLIATFNVS